MEFQSVRGFKDILPPESFRISDLEEAARKILKRYGYREIRLPTLEFEELYRRSTGETTDIVEKEMFVLKDAGDRILALRPEATPGIVRAYLENNLDKTQGYAKLFTIGSMFRAERPQAGRFREFEQVDAEYLGNPHPSADAELICALKEILEEAGLFDFSIELNSLGCAECRPAYKEKLLAFLQSRAQGLCSDCQRRILKNPLRALDCKLDGENLRSSAPRQELCSHCKKHFDQVREFLRATGISFLYNPNLVRGLDYYTRTIFEFKSQKLGSQDAVAAGGRYDTLVEQLGGPPTSAVGWALGVERTLVAIQKEKLQKTPEDSEPGLHVFVASQGSGTQTAAYEILQRIRKEGIHAEGGLFDKSLKAQLREADQLGCRYAVILGEEELKSQTATLKDLENGDQKKLSLPQLLDSLKITPS